MTEQTSYYEDSALLQLGLTQEDIDRRPVLAVGYSPKELLPPYKNADHHQRADEILNHVASAPLFMTFRTIVYPEAINFKRVFAGRKVVEIVGGHANWCVSEAVLSAINQGLYALVDSSKLLGFQSGRTDDDLGRMAMPEIGGKEGNMQLKLGEKVSLYYNPQRIKQFSK